MDTVKKFAASECQWLIMIIIMILVHVILALAEQKYKKLYENDKKKIKAIGLLSGLMFFSAWLMIVVLIIGHVWVFIVSLIKNLGAVDSTQKP